MVEEIKSMKRYESTFTKLSETLGVTGNYDSKNINFDCLRATVDGFEGKC